MGVVIVEWEGIILGVNVGHPIVNNGILCMRGGDMALSMIGLMSGDIAESFVSQMDKASIALKSLQTKAKVNLLTYVLNYLNKPLSLDSLFNVHGSFLCAVRILTAFSALILLVGQQEEHLAYKNECWGVGVVICLGRDADLHISQLTPMPLTVSCCRKSRLVLVLSF